MRNTIKRKAKISHRGNDYYMGDPYGAEYVEYESLDGERILVDQHGKPTHSTIADIEAWQDEKKHVRGL